MSTADLYAALIRYAEACEASVKGHDENSAHASARRVEGEAAAYRHAAELLRGAVAAAVEEERAAAAELVDATEAWCVRNDNTTGDTHGHASRALRSVAKRIRARGESPRGDAASGGREAP